MTTGAVTAGSLAAAASGFFAGRILDRFGGRLLVGLGAILMGVAFGIMEQDFIIHMQLRLEVLMYM